MLEVKLFGTGQARYHDRPIAGFPNRQANLLLCYLLLSRDRPHSREQLAAAFWGDYPTDVSRKHLSQAIWRLRNALQSVGAAVDDYLLISKDSISFLVSSPYWLDVERFETAIDHCQEVPGQDLSLKQAVQLEEAVDFYTGELLEGVYEDWCLSERERLNLLHLKTLAKLMRFHESNGNYERGLTHGERILACDNTRENVHRRMMRLYWLMGDRAAALAQFKLCVQILREELDIPPLRETEKLYQQMVHNQLGSIDPLDFQDSSLSTSSELDESLQIFAAHALQKLAQLRVTIEETNAELHTIERLLDQVLLKSQRG